MKTLYIKPGIFGLLYFLRDSDGVLRPVRLTVAELETLLSDGVSIVREGVSA